jgi:hypothetical protein
VSEVHVAVASPADHPALNELYRRWGYRGGMSDADVVNVQGRYHADGQMTFDYRIHDGTSSSRNAIALLDVVKLPAELVAEVVATLDWQSRSRPAPAALGDLP